MALASVSALDISVSALVAQKTRLGVATLNLANVNTAFSPSVPNPVPLYWVKMQPQFMQIYGQKFSAPNAILQQQPAKTRLAYQPEHPLANSKGFVAYADIDHTAQMLEMMSATRAYQANLVAFNTHKTVLSKLLEIIK